MKLEVPLYHMGLDASKTVFGGLRITQAQTSLRIRAVWSAPLLFAFLDSTMIDLAKGEISIFKLVLVAEETGLKLALTVTPKIGFLATGPNYWRSQRL